MQLQGPATAAGVNDENLSLLRMLNPEILADPNAFYRALRDYEPVHWDPYMHAWVVTSYQEVVTILLNYSADRTPARLISIGSGCRS